MRREETYEDLLEKNQIKKDLDREINKVFDENPGIKIDDATDRVLAKIKLPKEHKMRLMLYILKGIGKK